MTDQEIVQKLIEHDERITQTFFFVKCRPLIYSIIGKIFTYEVSYDELINELYVYLMENDARRLRSFDFESSIYQWIKTVAIRFFIKKRKMVIEDLSREALLSYDVAEDSRNHQSAHDDVARLLNRMTNERYRWVLEQTYFHDRDPEELAAEMDIKISNFYNIKKRAIAELTRIALTDKI